MKKSEIRKTCNITITDKEAKAILKDLKKIEYKTISQQTTWLKKYLKELAGVETEFNEKIESAEFFDNISTEEIYKFITENEPPHYDFNDNYEHRGYEFWIKEDLMSKEIIEFLQSKINRWREFMYHLRKKSAKNNDIVQVVLFEYLEINSLEVYMNGEIVMEERRGF